MYLLNNGWIEQMNKTGLSYDPKKDLRLYWLKSRLNKCENRYPDKDYRKVYKNKHLREEWLSPIERA